DHDGTVHGHQGQEEFRIDFSVRGDPIAHKRPQPTHVHIGETELQTEDHRQGAAEQCPHDACDQVLLCNYFMVFTEDVFRPEITAVMLVMSVVVVGMNILRCVNIRSCHVLNVLM